jgi:ansamitocin polyketide synthase A
LLNRYGSTETCSAIAANRPGDPYLEAGAGQPLPGVAVRLMDPAGLVGVLVGAEGEIWVRGLSLMLGYRNDTTVPFTATAGIAPAISGSGSDPGTCR